MCLELAYLTTSSNYWLKECLHYLNFCFLIRFTILFSSLIIYFLGDQEDEDKSVALKKEDLIFLSQNIGASWKRFARQFNITDRAIKNIEDRSSQEEDGYHEVFDALKRSDGSVRVKKIEIACKEIGVTKEVLEYLSKKESAHKNA